MISEEEFVRIAGFLKSRYGIDMSRKKVIVNGRLENYLRNNGWRSYHAYMDAVETDATGKLEKDLVDLLTTNHTFFMREADHFKYMKQVVLPWLKEKERVRRDLSIWCGAASSGQEPYTLAMICKDYFGLEHNSWDTKILATDVSTGVLQQAARGIYDREQIEPLPENWKRRFFRPLPNKEQFAVTNELKQEVIFRQFNLMDPFPFRRKMQVIFLRNVMIYFDEKTKKELVKKVYDIMEPGGYLFIGQTETLDRSNAPFQLIQPSIFRKQEGMR